MFGKISISLLILGMSVSASAQSTYTENIPLEIYGGTCPSSIRMGILGESVASGIRYTADIKSITIPGTLKAVKGPSNADDFYTDTVEYVIFTAKLAYPYKSCNADKYFSGPMGTTVRRITLKNGELRYVFKDPINLINGISTWNGQAILHFQERL
jgi:hypothetical protein